jgi:hypothetical protein
VGAATDGAENVRLAQEHPELTPLLDAIGAVRAAKAESASLETIL